MTDDNLIDDLKIQAEFAATSGQYEQALQCCEQLIALEPDNPEHYKNLGNAYRNLKCFEEAEASYFKALDVDPEFWRAYHNLGLLYSEKSMTNEAMNFYKKALSINNNPIITLNNLLNLQLDCHLWDESQQTYEKILSTGCPDHASCYTAGKYSYRFNEDYHTAEKLLLKAISIKPDIDWFYYELANCYYKQEKYHLSFSCLKSAIKLNSLHPPSIELFACLMLKLQGFSCAFSITNKAEQAMPEGSDLNKGIWNNLRSEVYFQQQSYEKSYAEVIKALEKEVNVSNLCAAVKICSKMAKFDESLNYLKQVSLIWPKHSWVESNKKSLLLHYNKLRYTQSEDTEAEKYANQFIPYLSFLEEV